MNKEKILLNELKKQNKNIYVSLQSNNIKVVYIEDKKTPTNNKYYIFIYDQNKNVKKNQLLLSKYKPQQIQNINNCEIKKELFNIIQKNNNNLTDNEIFRTINFLFRTITELQEQDHPQDIIISVLSDEPDLFNIIYDKNIISIDENSYLYISEGIKTDETTIYLSNDTYNKAHYLIIIDNENNKLINKYELTFKDVNNLNENEKFLLIGMLQTHTDNQDPNIILTKLINSLKNNIDNNITDNITNQTILNLFEENKNKIAIDKENQEKELLNSKIQDIAGNISLILNKLKGKEVNPKNLNRGDLSEYLAKYLSLKYGLILRSNVNTPHLLNTDNNCYELTDNEQILKLIAQDFGHNTISMKEAIKSLDYIDKRLKPCYNIIRFNNCIYDMEKHDTTTLNTPQLPYYDIYFNYNPKAKGKLIQKFLYTSLNEKQVQGLLELIGYLFTVGNKENIVICFIGKGGSGKSVLSNILTHLFKRVSNLPIHNLNGSHDLSILENKLLNICNDTDNKKIKDNGTFKQITGGDSIFINPKYRQPYEMPPQEVPKFIIVGNQFPQFETLEIPILERLMIIEFKRGFRNTKDQNKNLVDDIIKNNDNIEWLIYNSLLKYEELVLSHSDFTLRKNTEENTDLYNKHTNPLKWIVKKLIIFDDSIFLSDDINEQTSYKSYDYYIGVEELKQSIYKYAEKEGLDIGTNENNTISTQKLTNTIKSAFNLWNLKYNLGDEYKEIRKRERGTRRYVYPNIKFKNEIDE